MFESHHVSRWDVQDDLTRPVEATCRVPVHFTLHPGLPVEGLPDQRRPLRIDADTLQLAVEAEGYRAPRHRCRQPDEQHLVGHRLGRETGKGSQVDAVGVIAPCPAGRDGADVGQLAGNDAQLVGGGEGDRRSGELGSRRGHLDAGGYEDRRRLGRRQPEGHVRRRRRWREEAHPDELQEFHVVAIGHPVETVDELIRHEGERLDQGDTGVRDVVICPFRAAPLDQSFGVVDQVLEAPVVEVGGGQCHPAHSSSGIT